MSYETLILLQEKYNVLALLYLVLSLVAGLICVALGLIIGRTF
jgi:fluoride ion exporter CrcB/FEX